MTILLEYFFTVPLCGIINVSQIWQKRQAWLAPVFYYDVNTGKVSLE